MRPYQAVLLGIGVVVIAWGSLFITVLNQAQQTHELLKTDQVLLKQNSLIISGQTRTIKVLSDKIDSLQSHDDCLFKLATQPNQAYISDAQTCTISAPLSRPSSASAAALPQSSPVSSSSPQSAPSSTKAQAIKPQPTICQLSLGILGC